MNAPAMTEPGLSLNPQALGRLMPMFLWVGPDGTILDAGATLRKVAGRRPLVGAQFHDCFTPRRASGPGLAELARHAGQRLHLVFAHPPATYLRGAVVPLAAGQGLLVNLSFGHAVTDAVRDHDLTDADFAATDLTVDLLFLAEAKTAVMAELRDLNRRLQGAKSAAEEQALSDTLTGLRNRRAMDRVLAAAIEAGHPFALMHLDLDFFKQVNDTLGHAAGDEVLREVARVLVEETRTSDTVARVGGDEFVIIMPGLADEARLAAVAGRILARLAQPIDYGGQPCRVAGSIGTTLSTFYARPDADRMLMDADRALYASKRRGRSRATFVWELDAGDALTA
jgi:diguanylate cyclase (GGDEF)-like protein